MHHPRLFSSFFSGGFECSTHRRGDGRRLDLLQATGHDRWPERDYAALRRYGLRTLRDGLRWHLIEPRPGEYDWSSFLPLLGAAERQGMQVIWISVTTVGRITLISGARASWKGLPAMLRPWHSW